MYTPIYLHGSIRYTKRYHMIRLSYKDSCLQHRAQLYSFLTILLSYLCVRGKLQQQEVSSYLATQQP